MTVVGSEELVNFGGAVVMSVHQAPKSASNTECVSRTESTECVRVSSTECVNH